MRLKIKLMFLVILCGLPVFVLTAYSQQSNDAVTFEPDLRLPSAERQAYYAATVRYSFKAITVKATGLHKKIQGEFSDKLYLLNYTFPYFPGDGPYIGYQNLKINILPDYQAKVCKRTKKGDSDCETLSEGEHEYHAYAPITVDISRKPTSDTVELRYGRLPSIVRTFQSHSVIRNPNNDAYLNPNSVRIPTGFWVRFCKAEASDGRVSQCEMITTDSQYRQSGPYKFIEIGTGTPPSESNSRLVIRNPDVEKFKRSKKLPKPKSLLKPKRF